ncbi:hypothetical protein EIP86_004697 [Pleurotus ostreatoroseus]|nr:hypothetical protein EIP86_004697 [Pleurotus ostreatoroseus]
MPPALKRTGDSTASPNKRPRHDVSDTSPAPTSRTASPSNVDDHAHKASEAGTNPDKGQEGSQAAPTPTPVVATTAKSTVTETDRSYWYPALAERITNMLRYKNEGMTLYSTAYLPSLTLNWGPTRGGADNLDDYVCINDKKLTVWLLGEVEACFIYDEAGRTSNNINVVVKPFADSDNRILQHYLTQCCSRPIDFPIDPPDVVPCRRFQSRTMGRRVSAVDIEEFALGYDIRDRSFAERTSIHGSAFKKNDCVLVELYLNRYKVIPPGPTPSTSSSSQPGPSSSKAGGSSSGGGYYSKKKDWSRWMTKLELVSVNLLMDAPREVLVKSPTIVDI